jgi:hypothetical protein
MKKHSINLSSITPKGNVSLEIKDDMLYAETMQRIYTEFDKENIKINHYLTIADRYKLPFRIELTAKIDAPGLYLLLGNGHLNFGTLWSDNRRIDDIVEPNGKPRFFHNHMPMNEFVNITVTYDYEEMKVLINDEERFYSKKEKYMKSKMLKEFEDFGFSFGIACAKGVKLVIKALNITEYDESAKIEHSVGELPKPFLSNEAIATDEKPTFEKCINLLPEKIQEQIVNTDQFLRALKPMKFKRQIEKHGNKITYLASDYGFSYAIHPSNDVMYHSLGWYIITSCKPELWHRKADLMEVVLTRLEETSPELAKKMFFNLNECVGCYPVCKVKTQYEFHGKRKVVCHGLMRLKMCTADFEDARTFIGTINTIIKEQA